jgi:hypothetical protein
MGELLDKLNALDNGVRGSREPVQSLADRAARAFRSASQRVNDAIEAVQEPGMPPRHSQTLVATGAVAGLGVCFLGWRARRASTISTAVRDVVGAIVVGVGLKLSRMVARNCKPPFPPSAPPALAPVAPL